MMTFGENLLLMVPSTWFWGMYQAYPSWNSIAAGKGTGFDPLPSALFLSEPALLAALYHDLILKEYIWQSACAGQRRPCCHCSQDFARENCQTFSKYPAPAQCSHKSTCIVEKPDYGQAGIVAFTRAVRRFSWPAGPVWVTCHRTFGSVCDVFGLSSAFLFLDLSSAFHHLV